MATSAFKSTSKRSPIGSNSNGEEKSGGSSNRAHRRSRSLSRCPSDLRGRSFVNTVRGSAFPEITLLHDLAIDFFPRNHSTQNQNQKERGRSSRCSEISPATTATISSSPLRRGRSVSRQTSQVDRVSGRGKTTSDANSRRKRSVSLVPSQTSDSESDIDHSQNSGKHANMKSFDGGNSQMPSLQKPTVSSHRWLGRSPSQKDLSKNHDGYSSQSSALTDDEARDGHSSKNMIEKTIRAVYAQEKAMDRKTSALASGNRLQSDNSDVLQAVSTIRKNYSTKLEQSEKHKQDLLAEIVLEEQRGRELSKIVKELLPDPKSSTIVDKPSRARKSNDRNKVSKRLTEEAEKYFEDFISNVEDTDISSFDGERSDASSTLGVTKTRDAVSHSRETETFHSTAGSNSLPVEMDGVILPWLQWETTNDGSPLPSKNKRELPVTPKSILWDANQGEISAHDPSCHSTSSQWSWSPGMDCSSLSTREGTGSIPKELGSHQRSEFDMAKYLKLEKEEDLLFERWREQNRINWGGLLLCSNAFI
ncbi:dentin sialophosphoprotein-like isoform X3 [Camellia sinensis]|uniref:dentin sialophosphoprotein-like isoform X3 n=1 Tax=Camellia sinensis TaxID=4442 RepID=UPI0010357C18|nr:dentin sialophosphoprotein-like isoform X3 [Camellia sinensis]